MNEEIKIITLGDIFKNLETEEKAFKLKDYIISLQKELDQYKNNWEELKKWVEQEWLEWKDCEDAMTKNFATEDKTILNKMKELEGE